MPTFPEWDRIILDSLYEQVDFISLHRYYNLEEAGSIKDFLTSFANLDRFIATISATTDFVQAKKRSQKRVYLSLDEWNVWNHPFPEYKTWDFAKPRLEETYNLLDALVFAGLLCSILNHADRIKIACLAQLVNVIAPIMTQPGGAVVRQTIYYPFQQVSKFGRGQVLHPHLACPLHESIYGDVPILQTAVILNPARKELTIFILNCDQQEALEMELDLRDFGKLTPLEHQILHGADLTAFNNFENPERVKPQSLPVSGGDCHRFSVVIPKLSWNMLRYSYNL
jgi:alpha-N-arabinofuranosidase